MKKKVAYNPNRATYNVWDSEHAKIIERIETEIIPDTVETIFEYRPTLEKVQIGQAVNGTWLQWRVERGKRCEFNAFDNREEALHDAELLAQDIRDYPNP